jgi:hypothetical protein
MKGVLELLIILGLFSGLGYIIYNPTEVVHSSQPGYEYEIDESEIAIIPGKVNIVFTDTSYLKGQNFKSLRGIKVKKYNYRVSYETSYHTKNLEWKGVNASVEKAWVDSASTYYSFIHPPIPSPDKTIFFQQIAVDSVKTISIDSFKVFKNEIKIKLERIGDSTYSIE